MQMQHVGRGRQVVDDQFHHPGVVADGNEGDPVGPTLAPRVQQRRLRLPPRSDLCEHVHPVAGGIRRHAGVERRAGHPDVQHVRDIGLLWFRHWMQIPHKRPTGQQVRVPREARNRSGRSAAARAVRRIVAAQQLSGRLARRVHVTRIIQERPKSARVHPRHARGRSRLQKTCQVVGRCHEVIPGCLVGTHDDVRAFAGMQVEPGKHDGLHIGTIHRNERHVVPGDFDLKILRLPHHSDEPEAVALPALDSDLRPRVFRRAITPLAVPRCLVDLNANRVSGLRTLRAEAHVRVGVLVAQSDNALLLVQVPMRVGLGADDDGALEAAVRLERLHVRVVEVRPCVGPEAVRENPALGGDASLGDAVHAVHGRGAAHVQAVPVDGDRLGEQIVDDLHADQLALLGFQCGAGVRTIHQQSGLLVRCRNVERSSAYSLAAQVDGRAQEVHDPIPQVPSDSAVAGRLVECSRYRSNWGDAP
mmetsp:Transcript_33827/g.102231  ORF Transcript_33827/g.102231 Transcript_33827/m.102231 type:complete len:475 (-) Transcript_33827:21-1445(-)